ncbi:MAG TPA: pepsin/retropepsin-like aspartic protease family protein [Chitinophagaceae bacterium]
MTSNRLPAPRSTFSFADYDSASCTIPFVRAGNLIIVKARVDTTEGNFILDTGAPHLVLNITYFRHYQSHVEAEAEQTSITGSGSALVKTKVSTFSLGRLQYYGGEADLVDLGHIENSKGIKVLGLLGMELFKQCELVIDYEKNLLYLHRLTRKEASSYQSEHLGDAAHYRTFPIELLKNRILITTTMEGKKMKFVFDCAAESNVLDSRSPDRIMKHVTITRRVLLTGANSRKVEALYGSLANLSMGDLQINTLPVLITNLERTCFSDLGCIDGVLGFDFLSGKKIGFNFVTRKMYVWK